MSQPMTLADYLKTFAQGEPTKVAISQTIEAIAQAGCVLADMIAQGPLAGTLGAERGDNADGDIQKELDIRANDLFIEQLSGAPVAAIASEELDAAQATQTPDAPLCVALDPLDGSSNIDTNVSIGTIFSVLPAREGANGDAGHHFKQPGVNQVAAGYIIYGPQTALVLSVGEGTQIFTLDRASGAFCLTGENVKISAKTQEFAVNTSNYRHWDAHIRHYIDDCLEGADGPRGKDFNTRWVASLVADCHRILSRGGVFLYPGDSRPRYEHGRLRLLYEATPIAWLIEQAGGGATTGERRILEIAPEEIHERVPLIFGSAEEVERIQGYYNEPHAVERQSPLFGRRGLYRT